MSHVVACPRPSRAGLTARALLAASAALGLAAAPTAAQESPIVVEAHGGVAIPVGSFATGSEPGEGTEAGASFGVTIGVAGGGLWTPYVGFSQHRFGCEDAGCASGGRYVATGFHAGVRMLPISIPGPTLDLGCGRGATTLLLAEQGHRVRGVDVSHDSLRLAGDLLREHPEAGLVAGRIVPAVESSRRDCFTKRDRDTRRRHGRRVSRVTYSWRSWSEPMDL